MIRVENGVKIYRSGSTSVEALRGISVQIEQGEFVSIAGPSGSGKTTLLNVIGCIDSLTSGAVFMDNEELSQHSHRELTTLRRHKIGFVFQSYNLIPVMTAFENIALPLSLLKRPHKEIEQRVEQALNEVGLAGLGRRKPAELSGGQQQRVAIARALVKRPAVVLADEPTANLDSKTGHAVLELMRSLNSEHGITFVFSTHDTMVMDFARRLIYIHDGHIHSDDSGKQKKK